MSVPFVQPALAYAVGVLSQFMYSIRIPHLEAEKRILRYLKSSPGKGIWYASNRHLLISVYEDAMGIEVDKTKGANEPPAEILEEVERFQTRSLPNIEQTETCGNRGKPPRVTRAGWSSSPKKDLIRFLTEYQDVFAWSNEDMPGLDTKIVVHKLPVMPEFSPVKKKVRRSRPEWSLKVKIIKQKKAKFIVVSTYPIWLSNVVPVPKKDGRVRVGLPRPKSGQSQRRFPLATHRHSGRQCRGPWNVLLHGWILRIQQNFAWWRRSGKDSVHYTMGYLLLSSHALWTQECWGNLPKGHDHALP